MTAIRESARLPLGFNFPATRIRFRYVNYKMETEWRRVAPNYIWYGSSTYHRGEQWFMNAVDLDKNEERNFAVRDMTEVSWI